MNERQAVDEIISDERLWSNGSIVLYHVTPEENLDAIMREGIRPDLARGKMNASWYVNKHGVTWAIAHTSLRHNLAVSNLIVLTTMLPMLVVRRTGIRNVFCTKMRLKPEYFTQVEYWLYQEESRNA